MEQPLLDPNILKVPITGVLFVNQNFGRSKNKLLYRCIPTDKSLPACLIPYNAPVGFFKKPIQKYVLFHYCVPPPSSPPSHGQAGQLISVIGPVDDLHAYYDYLLYSKNLFYNQSWSRQSISRDVSATLSDDMNSHFGGCCQLPCSSTIDDVFTIDSADTIDFDDALQFQLLDDGRTFCVSVYITCVASYLTQLFGSSEWVHHLDSFSSNGSTLYLPHRRIPMLLDCISKQVSLKAGGATRLCIASRFYYNLDDCRLIKSHIELVHVRVLYNLSWSEGDLYAIPLHEFTQNLIYKTRGCHTDGKSRDTVAFWMIQYNRSLSQHFAKTTSSAWYRRSSATINSVCTPEMIHGQNLSLAPISNEFKFMFGIVPPKDDTISVPATNPMRRIVDLFNQYCLLYGGHDHFNTLIPTVNHSLKHILKVQRDCRLLDHFNHSSPVRIHTGIVFHKTHDIVLKKFIYSIFFRDLGVFLTLKTTTLLQFGPFPFRLFYFKDALHTKQKICISISLDESP